MLHRSETKLRRFRTSPTEDEAAAAAQQQQQQQQHQQMPLWHRLPGFRPSLGGRQQALAPIRPSPVGIEGSQGQDPAERWEQVPLSIQLMNEICDAMSIGSDFASWTGLVIIVVVLVGLIIWYSE